MEGTGRGRETPCLGPRQMGPSGSASRAAFLISTYSVHPEGCNPMDGPLCPHSERTLLARGQGRQNAKDGRNLASLGKLFNQLWLPCTRTAAGGPALPSVLSM